MRRLGLLLLSALGLAMPGCQRDDSSQLGEKLDTMIKKQEETNNLLRDLSKGGGARGMGAATGGAAGERKRPDPNEVYAVSPTGATVGPKDAKVTLVEAFDFA